MQTGARAIAKKAVFALTHLKGLLQKAHSFTNRIDAWERAKVSALSFFRAAVKGQTGPFIFVSQQDVGVAFIVAHQNIKRRAALLNQIVLENQRFGFSLGDCYIDLLDALDQRCGFWAQAGLAEIATNPVLQVFGFTHIKYLPLAIEHLIDARALSQ